MSRKKMLAMVPVLLVFILATACGQSGAGNNASPPDPASSPKGNEQVQQTQPKFDKPVDIVLFDNFSSANDDHVYTNAMYVDPVKKKYPNIHVQVVPGKKPDLEKMVAAGQVPDIINYNVNKINELDELGLITDLSDLIKANNVDLSRLEQPTLEAIKGYSSTKSISGLPHKGGFMALYYNKDIFDKFGVSYPTDDMTWDQSIELARKVTRTQDGVNYIGLYPGVEFIASSLTTDFFDPSGKASLSGQEWKQAFDVFERLSTIPGNRIVTDGKSSTIGAFSKDKNIAMYVSQNILTTLEAASGEGFNWDLVTIPKYTGKPVSGYGSAQGLFVTSASKNKDAAFQVITAPLTEEVQILEARSCGMPALKTDEVVKNFCLDKTYTKGKNIKAAFKFIPNWPKFATDFNVQAGNITATHSLDLYKGKDINTVIRETEEDINKQYAASKK